MNTEQPGNWDKNKKKNNKQLQKERIARKLGEK